MEAQPQESAGAPRHARPQTECACAEVLTARVATFKEQLQQVLLAPSIPVGLGANGRVVSSVTARLLPLHPAILSDTVLRSAE